nr:MULTISPECIES: transglycosylase domain-containing protein [unclassified Ruminococcus]
MHASKLNLTSIIYVYDDNNEPVEYDRLHSSENRIWVDLKDIPQYMKDAQVAIEDKRFYEHNGVDWTRTAGAVLSLAGGDSYGGSTLTQQLIKNITNDNEVSITRKLNEIFRALNLEREYTKDEILEAYLNIVNYGAGCNGVQSAANLYFAKNISDCSIAQCAAIAGITQNPSAYDPLEYPEANQKRRETVIRAMYDQEMITKEEYDEAMKESKNMKFVGNYNNPMLEQEEEEEENKSSVRNWYEDALLKDLTVDLAQALNISEESASSKIYTEGLKIYCAMDEDMQDFAEQYVLDMDTPSDPNLQTGIVMMGFDGRIIATVGSREKKTQDLVWDRTVDSTLQPGSSIKPVIPYPMAIEEGLYNFSSYVKDEPIEKWDKDENGNWKPGPNNSDGTYHHDILLPEAIERSLNAAAVQTMNLIGTKSAYNQAINKMGFRNLSSEDAQNLGALSIGGMNGGVTVREMVASYAYMGNGGKYYTPYTYYYVTDQNDNIIIDNRDAMPTKAYSEETATIMNRLLHYNVVYNNPSHTAAYIARIGSWDIIGKTGTTDWAIDHWFIGMSPYCVLGSWTGFDSPASIQGNGYAEQTFHDLMAHYLADKEYKEYELSDNVTPIAYCESTGKLASSYCYNTKIGYYTEDNRPEYCSGYHGYSSNYWNSSSSSSESSSSESSDYYTEPENDWTDYGGESSEYQTDTYVDVGVDDNPSSQTSVPADE